jgi:hypothetical protein
MTRTTIATSTTMPRVMTRRIGVSHITISQASRFVGVAQASAWRRLSSVAIYVLGIPMVPVDDVRKYRRDRIKAIKEASK